MAQDDRFHFPPEVFSLLVDTVPRLCRSKKDVLLFFQGAGVPARHLGDLREQVTKDPSSINKFEMVRKVLTRLNEDGDDGLRQRREVIKRVVEFDDFSSCWESDRLEAQGLVHQLRSVVNVKDSFTRMKDERDQVLAVHRKAHDERAAEKARRDGEREEIKKDPFALFAEANPQKRGKKLEAVLNRLFAFYSILVREAFVLRGNHREGIVEQIDGVVELDGYLYLVEIKWHGTALGVPEVSQHLVRVFTRGAARALIISDSGFTEPAIAQCRDALTQKVVALCELQEIVMILDGDGDLVERLRTKIQRAVVDRNPFART